MEPCSQTDQSGRPNGVGTGGWESFLPDRPLRVLLVEDDHATMQVVCALMSKCGYEVTPATNGLKAWELLQSSGQFDLVLADAMMPIFSGTDLLAKIMKSEAHRDTPVIMMSSHDSMDVVFKCLLRGAKDFLVKPLRKNELRNLWQHVWRKNHASRRHRSCSGVKETRRKTTCSGDVCSYSKDASQNSDQNTRSGSDNGSATQSLRATPLTVEEDFDRDQAVQQKHLQHASGMEQSQVLLLGHRDMDQQCLEDNGKQLLQRNDTQSNTESSEASERFAKAIDLIGTMTAEFKPRKEWNCEGEECTYEMSVLNAYPSSPTRFHPFPALELTLKRPSSNEDAWCDADARKVVKQSDCSAFSRYTNGGLVHLRQSISTGASLPSDQCSFAGGLSGISAPSGDRVGTANTAPTYAKLNERTAGNGSCGSSTLHFPQAISFRQGSQRGESTLSLLTSRGDYDERETVQEKKISSLTSPRLNSTTASNSNETLPYGNGHTGRYTVPQQNPCGADSAGSLWSFRQSEVVEREVCNDYNDNLEHEHHIHHLHRPQSVSCSEVAGVVSNHVQQTFFQKNLLSMPSDTEILATEQKPTACDMAANRQGSLDARGSGSNSGSREGSNFYDVYQNGQAGSSATAQDGCSVRETDDNSVMVYSGLAAHEGAMVQPDSCRTTLREAALNKFRQKRKIRCFEKKVRYQSRKKLAEQRPRVKGQFVRQAVFDAMGTFNKLDQEMVGS